MYSRLFNLLVGLLLLSSGASASDSDLISKIKAIIPTAEITTIANSDHFQEEYEILIPQMVDHNDPKAGYFMHRIFLGHYDLDSPVVFVTEGYNARDVTYELSRHLKTNQIISEYRYFGKSAPEEMDWQYLTNKQAMKDLHHIRRVFGKIYKNKNWIITGISKGGTTCLFYKATYPKDSRIAVPYVAPMATSPTDPRCDDHLQTVGSEACRNDLIEVQKAILDQKEEIIPIFEKYALEKKMKFSMGLEAALEYSVLELPFSFWQYAYPCEDIPKTNDASKLFQYLESISGFSLYEDQVIEFYKPAFYQFITENGYYGFLHSHLGDRLSALSRYDNHYFAPQEADLTFRPQFAQKAIKKLKCKKRILQIQGAYDPWAACGLVLDRKDQKYYVLPEGSHVTRISSFPEKTQEEIYATLRSWMK